jgi:hypothetical protein
MANAYRLPIPMSEETRAAMQALADARNGSMSSVCEEILEQCAPMAIQMANALKTAKQAPAAGMRQAVQALEAELANVDQMVMDLSPKATGKKKAG